MVVLDEPTTGLDVVTQASILAEIKRLCADHRISMIYVTHDLAVIAEVADRVAVMYAGVIVEEGPTPTILSGPRHPYTLGIVASIPDHRKPRALEAIPGIAVGVGNRPAGCPFAPRCSRRIDRCEREMPEPEEAERNHTIRCFAWRSTVPLASELELSDEETVVRHDAKLVLEVDHLRAEHRGRHEIVVAAADVSFEVHTGECVALVGESGSGKTTIARAIGGLHPIAGGEVRLGGERMPDLARKRTREQRRRIQLIFQNPTDALNPRETVGAAIVRAARALRGLSREAAQAEAESLLEQVRLPRRVTRMYPSELSGGECQRVAIARALASQPELLVCDEITSALDVSVQAAVLNLLANLRRELGLGLLLITHDLGVVASVADFVLVLNKGYVCEQTDVGSVLAAPKHPYTRRLVESAPSISGALEAWAVACRGQPEADPRPTCLPPEL